MNQSQIYSLARNAGLPDAKARIAAAIAMAESGGRETVVVDDSDDLSYGLWQINMKDSLGPARRAQFGLKSNTDLLNPATNARVMSEISKNGQNFNAWTTYTSGRYKNWLNNEVSLQDVVDGTNAVTGFLGDSVAKTQEALNALGKGTAAIEKTAEWVSNPRNWVRVAYVIGGGILVYIGLETLVLPWVTKPVAKVMGVVGPGGKIAKAAKTIGATNK